MKKASIILFLISLLMLLSGCFEKSYYSPQGGTMRNYEFTVIFDANDEMTEKGKQFVADQFAAAGVQVTKQEDMGVRNLAYEIKKQDKGHYVYFEIEANPESINKMGAEFLLQGFILKFLFVAK